MSRLESSKQGYQFEKELVDSLNGESVNLNVNVRIAKEVVLDYYNDFEKAIHIGSETSNKLGDIEILSRNNKSNSLEVKYVDIGNGTYHNTSINYFNVRFGTPKYTDYLLQNGYKDEVSPLLGVLLFTMNLILLLLLMKKVGLFVKIKSYMIK